MKIMLVISSWGIGGEQKAAANLLNQFINKGHNVDVVTFKIFEKNLPLNKEVNLLKIADSNSNSRFKNIGRIKQIRKLIKKNNYDVVIGFAIIPSIIISFAGYGLKIPLIVTERSNPDIYSRRYKIARAIAYRLADGAIFQTKDAKKYFDNYKKLEKKIIANPINSDEIPEVFYGKRNKRIVTTGRLVEVKNQALLIEAFSVISKEFPEYQLAIYGDGSLKENLNLQIKNLKLEDKAKIYEATSNVLEIIKFDSIFVLTSNHEGFPNSLAEALALGMPVISTDCKVGGPRDLLKSNRGILINPGDKDGLVEGIRTYLTDDIFKERVMKNAVKTRKELDSEVIAKDWIEYLVYLINKKKNAF